MKVTSETTFTSDTTARCRRCDWEADKALDTFHGRLLRGQARRHAERTGHEVMVFVERVSATYMRPAALDHLDSHEMTDPEHRRSER